MLTLLVGCAQPFPDAEPAPAEEVVVDGETETVPYVDDATVVEPLLSLEEVAVGIEQSIAAAMRIDPSSWFDAYEAVIGTDDTCPSYYDDYYELYGYDYWTGYCTDENDLTFYGYGYGVRYEPFESSGYTYNDYAWYSGNLSALGEADTRFDGAGYILFYEIDYQDYYRYNYGYVLGDFAWSGSADTWLGEGLSASLTIYGIEDTSYPGRSMMLQGSLTGYVGTVNTVSFDGVYIYTESMGSPCELEPSGTISVRDAAGDWYAVEFSGPAYQGAAAFPPLCDGCGEVYVQGASVGQVCPDFSPLLDWDGVSW